MTHCPACGCSRYETLFTVTTDEAAQHFVLKEGNPDRHDALRRHIGTLWGAGQCSVRRCADCGFGFADPYVAGDVTFYNLAYERAGYPSERWEFDRTVHDLESSRVSARRVLEVGAGLGLFLDKIVDRYVPRSGITALEFGDASMAALEAKGYQAHQEDIREAHLEQGFNAIFMFQVVEHMDRLDLLFARLGELLAPLGNAYISVPNPRCIEFNEQNASLMDIPPNHIGRWSALAFERLSHRHGLRLEAIETEPFSLVGFAMTDIGYSYLRRAQRSGSLTNWSRAQRSKRAGKLLGVGLALLFAPLRAPVWVKAARQRRQLGGCLWAKLSRSA
jgi:SAM-dependent methyltransferase